MATYSPHRLIMGREEIDIFFCLIGDIWNSSHRLIMGKEEIDNFFCLIGDILNFFLQKSLLSSPLRFI